MVCGRRVFVKKFMKRMTGCKRRRSKKKQRQQTAERRFHNTTEREHFKFPLQRRESITASIWAQGQNGAWILVVREETGGSWFPSLGAEFGKRFENGMEVELFSFGYFAVEDQHAWAGGARILKTLELSDEWTLTPFVGPTFARVRAVDEMTGNAAAVSHTMLLGGLLLERGPVEFGVFGTHSWFSRGTRALETHVDLEEMTHLAAYENNDGFARDSVGGEATWDATKRIQLSARYAAIFFPGESARHSVTVLPSVQIAERLRVSAGAQWLKGAGFDRVLFTCAFAWEF